MRRNTVFLGNNGINGRIVIGRNNTRFKELFCLQHGRKILLQPYTVFSFHGSYRCHHSVLRCSKRGCNVFLLPVVVEAVFSVSWSFEISLPGANDMVSLPPCLPSKKNRRIRSENKKSLQSRDAPQACVCFV